jgi:hypothetical protein
VKETLFATAESNITIEVMHSTELIGVNILEECINKSIISPHFS